MSIKETWRFGLLFTVLFSMVLGMVATIAGLISLAIFVSPWFILMWIFIPFVFGLTFATAFKFVDRMDEI
jgi:hypothetical protein